MKKLLKKLTVLFAIFANISLINMNFEDDEFLFGPTEQEWDDIESQMEGLGATSLRKSFRSLRKKATTATAKAKSITNNNLLSSTMTSGQKFLKAKVSALPPSMKKNFDNKNIKYGNHILYHLTTGLGAMSGITKLFGSNEKIESGYTNFNDLGVVPANIALAIDYIRIGVVDYTTANGPFSASMISVLDGSLPILESAEFELQINGESILNNIPLRAFCEGRKGGPVQPVGNNDVAFSGYNLDSMIFVKETDKVQAFIKLANGVSVPVATDHSFAIGLEFHGSAFSA